MWKVWYGRRMRTGDGRLPGHRRRQSTRNPMDPNDVGDACEPPRSRVSNASGELILPPTGTAGIPLSTLWRSSAQGTGNRDAASCAAEGNAQLSGTS